MRFVQIAESALDSFSNNPKLKSVLASLVPSLYRNWHKHFANLNAEEQLAKARVWIEEMLPFMSEKSRAVNGKPIACGQKCSACCLYVRRVDLTRLELKRILDLVERQGRLEEVAQRAELRRRRGKGACPLLGLDGNCTVYAERPLTCRKYHSLDRAACESGEDPLVPWIPSMVAMGIAVTSLAAGLQSFTFTNLYDALPAAIEARRAAQRKRARKRARRAKAA